MAILSPLDWTELAEGELDRRKKAAKRSGNPAWLWPEVSVPSWASATSQLAEAIRLILSGDLAQLGACEPLVFSLACYTSGTGPLLGWWLEQSRLTAPVELSSILAAHLEHARERARRTWILSKAVVALLLNQSIPVIVLKGGHTAFAYFPDPATRPATDLDLLVPARHAQAAGAALARAGFGCISTARRESSFALADGPREPVSLWLAHASDPWSVDLHNSLDFSASSGARLVRLDRTKPFENAVDWPPDPEAKALSQPLQLLHLAVHASGGLQSLTLLRMVELILVIKHDLTAGRLSWSKFLELGDAADGLGAAYPALAMCERMLAGSVPRQVMDRCRKAAPKRVRAIVDKLEPARAQRVDRASIEEHFMWVCGISGWIRQLGLDLFPPRSIRSIYEARAYRLLHGKISR